MSWLCGRFSALWPVLSSMAGSQLCGRFSSSVAGSLWSLLCGRAFGSLSALRMCSVLFAEVVQSMWPIEILPPDLLHACSWKEQNGQEGWGSVARIALDSASCSLSWLIKDLRKEDLALDAFRSWWYKNRRSATPFRAVVAGEERGGDWTGQCNIFFGI